MDQTPAQFFPEKMEYVEIISPLESAYFAIRKIAMSGILELLDLSKNSVVPDKRYTDTYLLCEECERSLRYFEEQLKKYKLMPEMIPLDSYINNPPNYNLSEIAEAIKETERQLHEKISIYEQLKKQKQFAKRKLELIRFFRPIMEREQNSMSQMNRSLSSSADTSKIELLTLDSQLIQNVTGFVPAESLMKLENTIYRVSRRNAVFNIGQVNASGLIPYSIFCSSETINMKVKKICECYDTAVFDFPSDTDSLASIENELTESLNQMANVDAATKHINTQFLTNVSQYFWTWKYIVQQEKQIWEAMDFGSFTEAEQSVIYKGWCPSRFVYKLPGILQEASQESGSPVAIRFHTSKPEEVEVRPVPTYIETNDFTYSFQLLNDAYGVPSYGEMNGGAFYCMYPFLFGIMFGDMGHAFFYILIALAMFFMDNQQKRSGKPITEMGTMIRRFKWLVLFLSICAFYCGMLYNECFGVPINFFGSSYRPLETPVNAGTKHWERIGNRTYPFGIDPVWPFKDNELIFLNSFKMKLSVIMGMIQMIFGMVIALINHIKSKNYGELIFTWIPNALYFIPFFGYLVVIVIMKWCMQFESGDASPNLIQVLIGMILPSDDPKLVFYKGQKGVEKFIFIVFIISIPLCLFGKPIYMFFRHHREEKFSIMEVFIMNLIHVIEFCLSALSHTASYLRLWALSLAHSQLSHVLWEQLFLMGANLSPGISWLGIFICFMAFAVMSVAILLGMEAFSALLHAIRLMWVEFSSKFYEGTGVEFKPLSLKASFETIGVR